MIEISLIQLKRGTKANLERVLRGDKKPAKGEPIWETDTNTLKLGDGVHNYIDLPYIKAQPTTELQVDDKSIELDNNDTLAIFNFSTAETGTIPIKTSSGEVEWKEIASVGTGDDAETLIFAQSSSSS